MPTPQTDRPVRYHLRIPIFPGSGDAEHRALWKVIRTARIDEVMFFAPHAEDYCPGLGTREENERFAKWIEPTFRKMRKAKLDPSINVFWTLGFSDFPTCPRGRRKQLPFPRAVSIDGKQSQPLFCPHDPAWRAHVCEMYRTFARLQPKRIWFDDDVRATLRADLHCPCMCEVCLDEMTRRTGAKRSRHELVKAILADPPNAVRDAWLDFQRELISTLLQSVASAVHEVSPQTNVGVMVSPAEIHFAEGRRWHEHLAALGQPTPYCRPHLGPYTEGVGVQAADGFNATRMLQALLPASVHVAPELENYPHSRHAKSVKAARLQMTLSQLLGINEITLSIYRFEGRLDLEREDVWERMLAESKPYFQAIADLGITRDQLRGIGLFWHEDVCRHVRGVTGASKPIFLYRQRPLDTALPLLGFATRYGAADVTVVTAEQVFCLNASELEQMFSRGVLLDARAAESLIAMGRGELAGVVRRIENARAVLETVEDKRFGRVGEPMSARSNGTPWQFGLQKSARVISKFRAFLGEETGHGAFVYENSLGGRVAVLPFDSQDDRAAQLGGGTSNAMLSPTFLSWTRQAQLLGALEWVGRKPVELFVPNAPSVFPLLTEQSARLIVGVANLLSDPIPALSLRLRMPSFAIRRVRTLTTDGKWRECPARIRKIKGGAVKISTSLAVDHLGVAVLLID